MKPLNLILIMLTSFFANAQSQIGLLCMDFTFNNEPKAIGLEYRKIAEGVLSTLPNPPLIIEREKMKTLLSKIQDERNLFEDLNSSEIGTLRAANVDFIAFGGFTMRVSNDEKYDFRMEFIKISGENSFSKTPTVTLRFTETELLNSELFENKITKMLQRYSFSKEFGVIDTLQLKKIKFALNEKDKKIRELEKKVTTLETGNLSKTQYDGSYLIKQGASTLVTSPTMESELFQALSILQKNKDHQGILKSSDQYYKENTDSQWLTPKLFKATALLNLKRTTDGIQLLDEIVNEASGEVDYLFQVAKLFKALGQNEKYDQTMAKIPREVRLLQERQGNEK